MIQPRLVWELARKDLLLFVADRRGMLLCFGIPILLASAFGAIFHRSEENVRPAVLVVPGADSPRMTRIVDQLCQDPRLQASRCDRNSAERRWASESGLLVILPEHLGQLQGKEIPRILVRHNPRHKWEARWVEGVLTEVLLRETLAPLANLHPGIKFERPFTVEHQSEPAGGALSVHSYSHSFCGMTLQYLLFWGMDSGLLLLRERRQGIWKRLRVAPVSLSTLVAGKALATTLIALAQVVVTFAFGAAVFGVRITGSPLGFLLLACAAAILSAATGLLVAALGGNEGRARSVAILVILTFSLLGGLWLPAFLLPAWVQQLGLALPTTWAARGLEGVTWQGMNLSGALPCVLALLGFSGVFLAVAWWTMFRMEGGSTCVN